MLQVRIIPQLPGAFVFAVALMGLFGQGAQRAQGRQRIADILRGLLCLLLAAGQQAQRRVQAILRRLAQGLEAFAQFLAFLRRGLRAGQADETGCPFGRNNFCPRQHIADLAGYLHIGMGGAFIAGGAVGQTGDLQAAPGQADRFLRLPQGGRPKLRKPGKPGKLNPIGLLMVMIQPFPGIFLGAQKDVQLADHLLDLHIRILVDQAAAILVRLLIECFHLF